MATSSRSRSFARYCAGAPAWSSQIPQTEQQAPRRWPGTISKRARSSLANHLNFDQGASTTFAAGASTIGSLGGNGLGARQ